MARAHVEVVGNEGNLGLKEVNPKLPDNQKIFVDLYRTFAASLANQSRFQLSAVLKPSLAILSEYRRQAPYSWMQFFSAADSRTDTEHCLAVDAILIHMSYGLINTSEELLLRLGVIADEAKSLDKCIKAITRQTPYISIAPYSYAEKVIAVFLNSLGQTGLDLSNIFDIRLHSRIDTLSVALQTNLHALLVSKEYSDAGKFVLFVTNIEQYIECFKAANSAYSIGVIVNKEKPIPDIGLLRDAVANALQKTIPCLTPGRDRLQIDGLIQTIKALDYQRPFVEQDPFDHPAVFGLNRH